MVRGLAKSGQIAPAAAGEADRRARCAIESVVIVKDAEQLFQMRRMTMKIYQLHDFRTGHTATANEIERISAALYDLFRAASTLSPQLVAEHVRLDVCNYARECEEELS